jgi:hypothetical protein
MSTRTKSQSKSKSKSEWSHGICDCCAGPDAGCNCCVQHCCCQPCVWGSSIGNADVPNAGLFTFLAICCRGSITFPCIGCAARRNIVDKYNIDESPTQTYFISWCCDPLARLQEVDMIMRKENLKYACASTVEDTTRAPASKPMRRP